MKADRAEQCHRQQPTQAGEPGCHCSGNPQHHQRHHPQHLLAHEHDDRDHPNRQKARNLAHCVQQANVGAIEIRSLDDKVVEQRAPGVEGDGHGQRHHKQQGRGAAPQRQRGSRIG
eukprot:CAMPEP_0195252506 /NCGR_PEP_ID=MMETSP0706-20130129/3899_1 /TAXON_ID=33640 /ORGANISM="Asterionellopsis glacialis, Strain CCMP134" /LENGTH=115 /DNA_ID=CAMNT_0040304807 /DNA_START=23 /DNA_END=366 /DNA_ORIENTATION=-